ncbi:MAG TPA: MFS transporter [Chloroflexota bacterium]
MASPPGDQSEPSAAGAWSWLYRIRTFETLQYREFRLLWAGQATIAMGMWMDQVSRGWLIYELTDSAFQLGSIRAVQAIPFFFLSPLAGTLADRYDRRLQMLVAQIINAFLYALLALLVITHLVQVWHVYVTAIATSIVGVFQNPPRQALVSETVPDRAIVNAIGLNTMMFNLSRTLGPALAGVTIAFAGTGGAYAVQTVFYVLATVWTFALRAESRPPVDHEPLSVGLVFKSQMEGWRFARNNEPVKIGILVAMIAGLLVIPFGTLLPIFARDILQAGPTGQGVLLTSMGVGALFSSVLMAYSGDRLPRGAIMLGGVAAYGLSVAAFASSTVFALSILLMAVAGVFHVSSQSLSQTVVQTYSPQAIRGRMMAVFQQNHVAQTLGGMLVGTLASLWGAPWALAAMGITCAVFMGIIALTMPAARAIR